MKTQTFLECFIQYLASVIFCVAVLLFCSPDVRADARPPQNITAVWRTSQHLDLFLTNDRGEVSSAWFEPGCGWQPWFSIHPESGEAAPGQPVTAVWRNANHLDLFMTGRDGRVMSAFFEKDSWHPWFAISPESATATAGQPVTAVWRNPDHLDLFMTDKDGRVMSAFFEKDAWQPWFAIPSHSAMAIPGQPITAVWRNADHLDLFMTRQDGRVVSTFFEGNSWQPDWFAIHPESAEATSGQPITAVWRNADHLDLFMTGRDGRVMSAFFEGNSWQPWFAIPPKSAVTIQGQAITAVWRNADHLDLFLTGREGRVITTSFEGNSWQTRWIPIDSPTPVAKPGQTITAVWANAGHLDLFLTGREGRVISTFFEGNSWQPDWFAIFPDANMLRDERNVTTELYNSERTGANLHESKLTPGLVRSGKFKRLVRWQVEGQVLAQPLYVRDVPVGPPTEHKTANLVIVATAANLLYAFDADNVDPKAQAVFTVNLGAADLQPEPTSPCFQTSPLVIGVTSTPVIDEATGILYVVNFDSKRGEHLIHALDLKHQFVELGKPVVIEAPGFDAKSERNRPSLLLMNQVVYVGFASFLCDGPTPFGGWVFGYKASTLERVAFWRNSVKDGGGIWQSGRGLVGGTDSSIYFETGNETNHPALDNNSLANSFIKLHASCQAPSLAASNLSIAGHFTPKNNSVLSVGDTDLGSSGPILLPGGRVVGGGKEGRVYVLDQGDLTLKQDNLNADGAEGFQAFQNTYRSDQSQPACPGLSKRSCTDMAAAETKSAKVPAFGDLDKGILAHQQCYYPPICYQLYQTFGPNIHAGFVYMPSEDPDTGLLYALAEKEYLRAFRYHPLTGMIEEQPALTNQQVRAPDGMPGGAISISANGNKDGIIWVSVHKDDAMNGVHPGTLFAVDASNFQLLWHDKIDAFAKFNPPTVADGKVFLAEFAALGSASATHPAGFGWLNVFGIADQRGQSDANRYGAPRRKAYGKPYRKPY